MSDSGECCATIDFVGELTIRNAAQSRERLLAAFTESSAVVAAIDPEVTVDLTFVQLIESARRTAREEGRGFTLSAPATGQLLESLQRGGFLSAPENCAFWLNMGGR